MDDWEKDFTKSGSIMTCVIGLRIDGGIRVCADDDFTPPALANYLLAIAKELRKRHKKAN